MSIKDKLFKRVPKFLEKRLEPNKWQIKVDNIDEYFNLPKEKRTRWGLYLIPYALPFDHFENDKNGWEGFYERIKKEYPIQWFIRKWLPSINNPIARFFKKIKWRLEDYYHNIRRLISPPHARRLKAYPRWAYMDIQYAVEKINFALLLDFWYEEVAGGIVDWHSDLETQEVYNWMKEAVDWIEIGKPALEEELAKERDIAFHNRRHHTSFNDVYAKEEAIEKEIRDRDTKILQEFIAKREWFWT